MNEVAAPQPRVLAYRRHAQNKRRARILLAAFTLISLPAAAFLAAYLVFFFAVLVGMALGVLTAGGALGGDWGAWAAVVVASAVVLALLTPLVMFLRATSLVLRLSRARPVPAGEQPDLRRTVENLCIGSGLPWPRLLSSPRPAPRPLKWTGSRPAHSSPATSPRETT
jgi:hypothetical protein